MTTCENCGADEFTCAGCGVLQKPDDFPCCSQPAPSSSQSGSSDMDIPLEAVDAAAGSLLRVEPDAGGERARIRAQCALVAAFPHLRPLFQQATELGVALGRAEAGEEIAAAIEVRQRAAGRAVAYEAFAIAARVARDLTKGDPK